MMLATRHRCRWILPALFATLFFGISLADTPPPAAAAPAPANGASDAAAANSNADAIALADIASRSETDLARVEATQKEIDGQAAVDSISRALPDFKHEIDVRLHESKKVVAAKSSLNALRSLERSWREMRQTLHVWQEDLKSRIQQLDGSDSALQEIENTWEATQRVTTADSSVPAVILERIGEVLTAVRHSRQSLGVARGRLLTLVDSVSDQDARVATEIDSLRTTRTQAMGRLLHKDGQPIWDGTFNRSAKVDFGSDGLDSILSQRSGLAAYAARQTEHFGLQLVLFIVLLLALRQLRSKAQDWVKEDPALESSLRIFESPVAGAALLALLMSLWIYPQAPRALLALIGAFGLIPAVILLRHVIVRPLFPLLNGLVLFYFLDQLRDITASLPWVSRVLLLAEAAAGALLCAWFLRTRVAAVKPSSPPLFWTTLRAGSCVAAVIFTVSLLANVLGYVELADLLTSALLASAYAALFIYALLRIADGLLLTSLRLYPLAGLAVVRKHRSLIHRRILVILEYGAWLLWALGALERLALRLPLLNLLRSILGARSDVGSLRISLGDVLACVAAVFAAVLISRLVRFALEEEVYTRVNLPRGVPYAISQLSHYAILVVGFIIAIAVAGVDLTRFTILVSAFGVGIGFGLQNIINNFVSGLILLFERPVQVGDAVQIADVAGVIDRIGIRASQIRLSNGAEVIVPNSSFITERVTNRALSNPERVVEIRVGVAYGNEPQDVVSQLLEIAANNTRICKSPAPVALFTEFTESGVFFVLRGTTDNPGDLAQTRSELGLAIEKLFAEGKLQPPTRKLPDADIHIKT